MVRIKDKNQIECLNKVNKLTEKIKNTTDSNEIKQLKRQRRAIMYKIVHNK